jgi:hypothetical protein
MQQKIIHAKSKHKKADVAILLSDKVDFQTRIFQNDQMPNLKVKFNNVKCIGT